METLETQQAVIILCIKMKRNLWAVKEEEGGEQKEGVRVWLGLAMM